MKRVCVFLADGFEEIEGLMVVDILRRAQIEVTMVSVGGRKEVTGAHDITVLADQLFDEVDYSSMDMLVLPGGMPGTTNLQRHPGLRKLLPEFAEQGKIIAAICAAPSILGELGLLAGRRATSYPSVEDQLTGANVVREAVVRDGNVITSRGLGTALDFSLALLAILDGNERSDQIAKAVIYNGANE